MPGWQETYTPPHWSVIQQRVALAGAVSDEATGMPIAGAVVEIMSGPRTGHQTSAVDGSYRFTDLPPGSYRLRVSVPALGSRYDTYETDPIAVTEARAADGRLAVAMENIPLSPTRVHGTVQGKQNDGSLAAIAGATVRLHGELNAVLTDDNGQYTLSGIVAGAQTIEAAAARFQAKAMPIMLETGKDFSLDLTLDPEPPKKPNGAATSGSS